MMGLCEFFLLFFVFFLTPMRQSPSSIGSSASRAKLAPDSALKSDFTRAARVTGWFGFVFALMQFLASPLLGSLSDRFGRRPVSLISSAGLGLDYVLMAVAPNVSWLFVGRLISGVSAATLPPPAPTSPTSPRRKSAPLALGC